MNSDNAGSTPQNNPTLVTKTSEIETSSFKMNVPDSDFKHFVDSGWSVNLALPLIKNSSDPLFAINTDGFMPSYNFNNTLFQGAMKNLCPVQPFANSLGIVKIEWEMSMLPAMALYLSHRMSSGAVGVGVRLTSNTAQSGNFIYTEFTGLMRRYYTPTELYKGLQFLNQNVSAKNSTIDNFIIQNASLNYNLTYTPLSTDPMPVRDHAYKLSAMSTTATRQFADLNYLNMFSSQFLENWIVVAPLSNLPALAANNITFNIFFDYSRVTFYMPLLPTISSPPGNFSKQIMKVSDTLAQTTFTVAQAIFLPGTDG